MGETATTLAFVGNSAYSMYNFRQGVLRAFLADGYHVVVIAPPDDWAERLREIGVDFRELHLNPRGANPLQDLALAFRLLAILKDVRAKLVFNYTIKPVIYGTLAARLLGLPSIAVMTGLGHVFSQNGLVSKTAKGLYRISLRFPHEIWFLNREDRDCLLESDLLSHDRVRVLPGEGVDLEQFQPVWDKPNGPIAFLFMGRMLREKGVVEFVEAARSVRKVHPQLRFQLLGPADCSSPGALSRSAIAEWEDEGVVEYLGNVLDVRPYLNAASCVVLPSYYKEGVPRTLLEASATALPVVTTDNIGCRDAVVDGETGLLCRPRDAVDLAAKLEVFLNLDEEERAAMGARGRSFVCRNFDLTRVIRIYRETVAGILGPSTDPVMKPIR